MVVLNWTTRGLILALLMGVGSAAARAQVSREYQIKAVFLFHFAQFTDWPTNTFGGTNTVDAATNTIATSTNGVSAAGQPSEAAAAADEVTVIGVLGSDPFGTVLDETVRGEGAHGRRLVVERYRHVEEVGACHILYISRSEAWRVDAIAAQLKGKPVLTVSDSVRAAERGVMIQFVTESNKVRFRINLDAVSESGLTLSSKLLRAAERISSPRAP